MNTRIWPSLALAGCLLIAGGCRSDHTENVGVVADREMSPTTSEASDVPESPERTGRFRRTPPGRGLGRGSAAQGYGRGRTEPYPVVQLTAAEMDSLGVATARATFRSIRASHPAMGTVMTPQSRMAKVSYAFPARISAVHVVIGDWVEQGQLVLTLESEEVGRAKSEYYKAIAEVELARQNYERERRLSERGVGAQKNTLAREAELTVARASLDAAEKKLHVLGFSEEDVRQITESHQVHPEITVSAPITGRIVEHNAVLGSMIDQSTDLMTIMDPTLVWVTAEIFERDIAKIRVGQQVDVTVPAYPGELFRGRVSYISQIMNQETRTLSVRAEVPNKDFRLKDGMFTEVSIVLNGGERVLTVPSDAILEDQNETIVFVKSDDQYTPRPVLVSARQSDYCAIAEGLREGEEVVVKEAYMLKSKLYDDLTEGAHVH